MAQIELKINDENKDNSIVKMFIESGLRDALKESNIAIQGELMGPGIQGNREGLKSNRFFIFDMQNLGEDGGEHLCSSDRLRVLEMLYARGVNMAMVGHVSILNYRASLESLNVTNVDELLKFAEGPSIVNPVREGLVFKRVDGKFSFKAISNEFLRKEKD
jgi:hypothetical protein